jgi:hypothetical protein
MHTLPPPPHASSSVPGSQVATSQQPLHDVPSQMHRPVSQCWPLPHEPSWHEPPHPSSAPQALPVQLGTQPQTPVVPPPPHWSGLAHPVPVQHGWPLPPHVPQSTPHVWPLAQGAHTTPPLPQDVSTVPDAQVLPLQHPAHDVASHRHTPATHRWP